MNSVFARVGFLITGSLAAWEVFRHGPGPHGPLRWIGLVMAALGLAGLIVARWTLGKAFSITPQARQLVTHGIYSKIRHPIYVFSSIWLAGLILMVQWRYLWALLGMIVIVQVLRARQEARVLEARFGDQYREYRRSSWF